MNYYGRRRVYALAWGTVRTPPHPSRDQIALPGVLEALSDPTRLAIALKLAQSRDTDAETMCSEFLCYGSKTNLSYHFAKLRKAGITRVRVAGTRRFISLRWDDMDARFPGLLASLLGAAKREGQNFATPLAKRAARAVGRTRSPARRRSAA